MINPFETLWPVDSGDKLELFHPGILKIIKITLEGLVKIWVCAPPQFLIQKDWRAGIFAFLANPQKFYLGTTL